MRRPKSSFSIYFSEGFQDGIPIALGYISVSFAFGLAAIRNGLPSWVPLFISMTNFTSAGQFAGMDLLLAGAGLLEIVAAILVINIRYMLMSFSLTQKISKRMRFWQRFVLSFGITDEIFALASQRIQPLKPAYLGGLILSPYLGWVLGTLLGATAGFMLPPAWRSALGVALYAMFIAIIIPPAKKYSPVFVVVIIAAALSCVLRYVPVLSTISGGWRIIICALAASGAGALFCPVSEARLRLRR
ncbi:MAG: AzlC family ABC transporter permease [Peptococcaceae bacterium]|jgi:4-azaleucine resistance transporter AzlC|nr:AzlC family ABC transporter permease [Peptococcaceae bacterium]